MRARVKELRSRPRGSKPDGEAALQAAIAAMSPASRALAKRLHAIITSNAPALSPKTWYGMPAYAREDGVVLFFRPAEKFKERYMTLGFNDSAHLDEGHLWPVSFALTELSEADEARIAELVRKAVR